MNKEHNPAAFPLSIQGESVGFGNEGMTLRDYFAAKVLQALIAEGKGLSEVAEDEGKPLIRIAPKMAYEMADAMLAERIK